MAAFGHHRRWIFRPGKTSIDIIKRNLQFIDEIIAVTGEDSPAEMRRLARDHRLLVGPSSGAHLVAARRLRAERPELQHVVTVLCDEGEKYLSEYFAIR